MAPSSFSALTKSFSRASKPQPTTSPRDEYDGFLSSDVDDRSNMSLNSPQGATYLGVPHHHAKLGATYSPVPMDISPLPPTSKQVTGRPRAHTVRHFGRDAANTPSPVPSANVHKDADRSSNRGRQRSALPSQWMSAPSPPKSKVSDGTLVDRSLTPPACVSDCDAMDVDSPAPVASKSAPSSPTLHQAPPHSGAAGDFTDIWYNDMSPAAPPPLSKKRRSMSPDPAPFEPQSSSPAGSSPIARKFERFASTGQTAGPLFKKPAVGGNTSLANKRPRRPALSALIAPSDADAVQSAYPALDSGNKENVVKVPAPVRRAFSAFVQPNFVLPGVDLSSDDTSAEFEGSSPAGAYARRQEARVVRKADGSTAFKPINGAGALEQRDREQVRGQAGMPEFGDCEAEGKILPCYKVKSDGLMRIDCDTLNDLLDGNYDNEIRDFKVIDCRFPYEYAGGHIPGAVNCTSMSAMEELFLGDDMPEPCTSGGPVLKTILIFHCELSEKRAPTYAKLLRSKDRALVGKDLYPMVHYPELYILSGGYKKYFSEHPDRCEPRGYVEMQDAAHKATCDQQMARFNKWERTKSYTFGERTAAPPMRPPQRNSAPTGGLHMFAAASAARGRRVGIGSELDTLKEDAGYSTSHSGEDGTDINDSPCPSRLPPSKAAMAAKPPKPRALVRAVTYAPGNY